MPVYMIAEVRVENGELYARYVKQVRGVVEKHGGRYLARGGQVTTLSGGWAADRIILVAFESLEQLQRCFGSAEYRALSPLREQSTTSRAIAVEGFEG